MHSSLPYLALAGVLATVPVPLAAQNEEAGAGALSVVAGRIVDHATGMPIADAVVELTPRTAGAAGERRISDDDGMFRFDDVAPGAYAFSVSALGYAATDEALDVSPQSDVRVDVRLTASAIELQPILVETSRRPAFMDGFEARRAAAARHTGFFTSAEIMALEPKYITEVFQGVPGTLMVTSSAVSGDLLMLDGNPGAPRRCLPNVFLNGVPLTGNEVRQETVDIEGAVVGGQPIGIPINELYPPEDIAAIEIYALDKDVPREFQAFRDIPTQVPGFGDHNKDGKCGALVIWLKDGAQGRQFANVWKRLLGGLAAAAALLMLTT